MRCYYEELGVEQNANDTEIKKSFRRLALLWHPDKNLDRAEEAKEKFQLLQQAYEVLSDPHERAFYDSHREQILRGKSSNYEDNCLDLFPYFTVSCFKGYGNDENGFYAVYRKIFMNLTAEDAKFMDDKEEIAGIPSFGDANSSYEEVVGPFYAYWRSYCTKRSYAWLCPYDIQEIRDRRILRGVEKEMKKIVQKAKRERNEEVRNLVAFVRKRDKRWQAHNRLLEERAELNRQKQAQNRREKMLKRQLELAELRKSVNNVEKEDYEEQLKQLEQQYSVGSDTEIDSEHDWDTDNEENDSRKENDDSEQLQELYGNSLFCIACCRIFKNTKAFANHEAGRKHRENEENLKMEMLDEEQAYQDAILDGGASSESELTDRGSNAEENVDELVMNIDGVSITSHNEAVKEVPIEKIKNNKRNKKAKKGKSKGYLLEVTNDSDEDEHAGVPADQPPLALSNLSKNSDDEEDWANNTSKKNSRKTKKKQTRQANTQTTTKTTDEDSHNALPKSNNIKNSTEAANGHADPTRSSINMYVCVMCQSNFESKNKLFAHLKKTNHGVYIPKPSASLSAVGVAAGVSKKVKGKRK